MSCSTKLLIAACIAALCVPAAYAEKKTVCTITVNSPDEKQAFQRSLPADKFEFVELVEKGRPDWLASACARDIRCDVLVISGHYDGGHEFFSDNVTAQEFLPVDEMERASCSNSCPGLFSQLKEVYLFGCNTLNPEARNGAAAEVERTLIRSGRSRAEAERVARALNAQHGESARDRMRDIFKDVPVIYGFSSVAPVGPIAGAILGRYFRAGGASEVASGRPSARLFAQFSNQSLAVTSGSTDADLRAAHRRDVCQFSDDRLTPAQRLGFVHRLLDRDPGEVRMFFDRLERVAASLDAAKPSSPALSSALDDIANDRAARERYLDFTRNIDRADVHARMLDLAADLRWLTPEGKRAALTRMIADDIARNAVDAAEVDLVCRLNLDGGLNSALQSLQVTPDETPRTATAAVRACLGSTQARAEVVRALTGPTDADVEIAQVYLRNRPITDPVELKALTFAIAKMDNPQAQTRALETLAQLKPTDRESLQQLARLFPFAGSVGVQTAIAGVLLRADTDTIASPELVQTLRERRLKVSGGGNLVDVLIRRLEAD
jgi:hypothetical protein